MSQELNEWKNGGKSIDFRGMEVFCRATSGGEPILLIHGYPYNSYDWHRVWRLFPSDLSPLAFDLPGLGFSSKPRDIVYDFDLWSDAAGRVASEFGVRECHVVAHDLGDSVAQELLARHEEGSLGFGIKSLALLNGGLFPDVYRPRLIQRLLSKSPEPIGRFVSRNLPRTAVERATLEVFGERVRPDAELLDDFWEILNHNEGKAITHLIGRAVFLKDLYQDRWLGAMRRTSVPFCFINGPADPNSGMHMARRFAELFPTSQLILLADDIGHWPQLEDPDGVATAIREFVAKIG